jgi:cellobiose phosphorylase
VWIIAALATISTSADAFGCLGLIAPFNHESHEDTKITKARNQ